MSSSIKILAFVPGYPNIVMVGKQGPLGSNGMAVTDESCCTQSNSKLGRRPSMGRRRQVLPVVYCQSEIKIAPQDHRCREDNMWCEWSCIKQVTVSHFRVLKVKQNVWPRNAAPQMPSLV